MERDFFIGLPKDKTQGFCQPADSGIYKDGGFVVNIFSDCVKCQVGECFMFEAICDQKGKILKRKYIKHLPAY